MRGTWESQTRRLNRHYQSVKRKTEGETFGFTNMYTAYISRYGERFGYENNYTVRSL